MATQKGFKKGKSKRSPKEGFKRFEINQPSKVIDDFNEAVSKREGSTYYRTRIIRKLMDKYTKGEI